MPDCCNESSILFGYGINHGFQMSPKFLDLAMAVTGLVMSLAQTQQMDLPQGSHKNHRPRAWSKHVQTPKAF